MHRLLLPLAVAAFIALAPPARATSACGASAYSYAGVLSAGAGSGVSATITPLRTPRLSGGHIAAWVGVGGPGLGPNRTDEWLQAGISAEPGRGVALYYELALPNEPVRYVMMKGHLRLDRGYHIAVLESKRHAGSW